MQSSLFVICISACCIIVFNAAPYTQPTFSVCYVPNNSSKPQKYVHHRTRSDMTIQSLISAGDADSPAAEASIPSHSNVKNVRWEGPRSPLTKLQTLFATEFGTKSFFLVIQLFFILISINLCGVITNFQIPKILKFLLCANTASLMIHNIMACINSILHFQTYDLTFLFCTNNFSFFLLFYILSLRISISAIINVYFMNTIIWSWVHSRLRGMARLIRDKSGSGSTSNSSNSSNVDCDSITQTTPQHEPSSCTQLPSQVNEGSVCDYNIDWWSLIYCKYRHCLFRRSLLSVMLLLFCAIIFAVLVQEIIPVNENTCIKFDTSVGTNELYLWSFIIPNCIIYMIGCICWIFAIFVENKRTFIMDLCEKESARLLKMIGICYIITQAIFVPTLMVNTTTVSKPTQNAIEMLRHSGYSMQCMVDCIICVYWLFTTQPPLSKIGGIDNHLTPKRVLRNSNHSPLRNSPNRAICEKNKHTTNGNNSQIKMMNRFPISDIPFTDGMRKIQRTLDGRNWRVCMGVKKQLDIISETSVWQTSIKECTETGFSLSSSEGEGSGSFNLLKWNELGNKPPWLFNEHNFVNSKVVFKQ